MESVFFSLVYGFIRKPPNREHKGDISMKTGVLNKYFVWLAICCTVVFSSCNTDSGITEEVNGTSGGDFDGYIFPTVFGRCGFGCPTGEPIEWTVRFTTEPEGTLTYSWSVEEKLGTGTFIKGKLHPDTGPVVSYTFPNVKDKENDRIRIKCVVSNGAATDSFTVYFRWDQKPTIGGVWVHSIP